MGKCFIKENKYCKEPYCEWINAVMKENIAKQKYIDACKKELDLLRFEREKKKILERLIIKK